MKVLILGYGDNGGATWFVSQAINRYTDHVARGVRMVQNYLDYPHDILEPGAQRLRNLWAWADVVHVRDSAFFMPDGLPHKPTVVTYTGKSYRRNFVKHHRQCKERHWLATCSTIDMRAYYPADPPIWLPNPREDMLDRADPDPGRFVAVHAPTMRERKGTATIIKAVAGLEGVELELIEQTTYAECLRRKAAGHVVVDQFRMGYGNNAVEGWALGLPAIGGVMAEKFGRPLLEHAGYLPYVKASETVESISHWLARLRDDPDFYRQARERGRAYFFQYHHAPVVAQKAVALYEQARDMI